MSEKFFHCILNLPPLFCQECSSDPVSFRRWAACATFLGQPLGVGFEDVPLGFLDDGRVAWILAEPLDELGRIGPVEALLLVIRSVFGDKLDAGTSAPYTATRHQR